MSFGMAGRPVANRRRRYIIIAIAFFVYPDDADATKPGKSVTDMLFRR